MKLKKQILSLLCITATLSSGVSAYANTASGISDLINSNIPNINADDSIANSESLEAFYNSSSDDKNIYNYFYDNSISMLSVGTWGSRDTCYGDTLDDVQRIIYDTLVNNFDSAVSEKTCYINSSVTKSECEKALEGARQAFFLDYPERFWNDDFEIANFKKTSSGAEITISWNSDFFSNASDVNSKMNVLESRADNIINNMNNSSTVKSDGDKIAYLHNWLLDNVSYDYSAASAGIYNDPEPYTAYGAIVSGKAVCQGYSHAMTLLCKKAGITCITVMGYKQGTPHSWNYVKLIGDFYLVDSTNDDGGGYKYRYFLIPSSSKYVSNLIFYLPSTANDSYVKYGDVDEDNSINIFDASWISGYSSSTNKDSYRSQISEIGFIAADVNGDNNVDSTDSNEVLNKVLDSTYQLPVYNKLG